MFNPESPWGGAMIAQRFGSQSAVGQAKQLKFGMFTP
jgi:hypothetical protein